MLLAILISLSLFSLGIVHADPDVVDSHPTEDVTTGGLSVTNAPHAYDQDHATHAAFSYAEVTSGGFEVKNFTIPHFNYSLTQVDFKMRYNVSNGNEKSEFRILYYVDPSSTATVLQPWTSPTSETWTPRVWADQPEPNDGSWSWTDINHIRFLVETHKLGGGAKGDFEEYEAWVTVTGVKPSTGLYVQPSSVIDYNLTPESNKTIRPNANSAYGHTTWTGDYTDWNEAAQNSDTDYVKATTYMLTETSQLDDVTPDPAWTIANVRVVAYARTNITTDEELVFVLVVGGTKYWAGYPAWPMPGYTLTTTYQKYSWEWGKNPDTDDYWTWSDIDALEAGVESQVSSDYVWTGEIRVTQLYVEVEGPRFTVDVEVSNVEDIWGYSFILDYDTTLLTATSYKTYDPFTYALPSEINDTAGYVSVSYSKPMGEPGVNTTFPTFSMPLVEIAFLVEDLGATDLDLHTTKLTDSEAEYISHVVTDGYFKNQEAVPEFPFGMVMELSVIVVIVYVWWKRRNKIKIPQ